jgi:hypothetical protein
MAREIELRNLTPHEVVVDAGSGTVRLPPSGVVARCTTTRDILEHVSVEDVAVPLTRVRVVECQDLPQPEAGVMLMVSRLVAEARPDRADLVVPDDAIRDDQGRIVAVRALARLNDPAS